MSVCRPWRQDPDIGPKAIEVAKRLCELARENSGTYVYSYAGYQRVVVTNDHNGIRARFETCKPEPKLPDVDSLDEEG